MKYFGELRGAARAAKPVLDILPQNRGGGSQTVFTHSRRWL